jgi:glycogen synthase
MKILMVSNLYPPHFVGGYEVRCAQVAEALQSKGHEVHVLTSTYGLSRSLFGSPRRHTEIINGVQIHRCLNQYHYQPQPNRLPGRLFDVKRHFEDIQQFQTLLSDIQPDIVNWWSMFGLSKMLLPLPSQWKIPDVHWIEHWWMIREYGANGEMAAANWGDCWDGHWGPSVCRPFFRVAGRRWEQRFSHAGFPTREFPNQPRHVCFVSEYLRNLHREAGLEFQSSSVIYGGVPVNQFYQPINGRHVLSNPLRILYAGQITEDRGLHTVIEALGLMGETLRSQLKLSIAGPTTSEYFSQIQTQVEKNGLGDCVEILGKVSHDQMPEVYLQHDVLVFPSMRDEGLPLTMVEAMMAGCAVLTTGSGGAMEVAKLANLPLFPKGDGEALSRLLEKFLTDRNLLLGVAKEGQDTAISEFNLDRMISRWDTTLHSCVAESYPKEMLANG